MITPKVGYLGQPQELYSKEGITELEYNNDTRKLWAKMPIYSIPIDYKKQTINLNQFDNLDIGKIKYILSKKFLNKNIYEHKFFFINEKDKVKNKQTLIYDPLNKIIVYFHKTYFSISSLCR